MILQNLMQQGFVREEKHLPREATWPRWQTVFYMKMGWFDSLAH